MYSKFDEIAKQHLDNQKSIYFVNKDSHGFDPESLKNARVDDN